MAVKPGSQNARILQALAGGTWQTVEAIHSKAGTCRLNSRISELRKHGYTIEHDTVPGKTGARGHRYRLLGGPGETLLLDVRSEIEEIVEDTPDFEDAPRTPVHRFRIYRLYDDNSREIVCTTPTAAGVGTAICELGREGEFTRCSVGVFDCAGPDGDYSRGVWLVNPWDARSM